MSGKQFTIKTKKYGIYNEITEVYKEETVESFLARGGTINQVSEGDSAKRKKKSNRISIEDLLSKCVTEEQRNKVKALFGDK